MLALRRKGPRTGVFVLGEEGVLFRWLSLLAEGDEGCDEVGRAAEEGVVIESRFSAFDSEVSFLFIAGGNGA